MSDNIGEKIKTRNNNEVKFMTSGTDNTLKCKTPITVLSIISLILTIIGCIGYFIYYDFHLSNGNLYTELTVRSLDIIDSLSFVVEFAPVVLMFLYIVFFYKRYKASVLVSISCGLIALSPVLQIIDSIIFFFDSRFYSEFVLYFDTELYSDFISYNSDYIIALVVDLVIDLVTIVAFILLTVSVLKGLHKKIYAIIAVTIGILTQIYSLSRTFKFFDDYIKEGLYLYFTRPVAVVGTIVLYVAILLFALNNRTPALISKQKTEC